MPDPERSNRGIRNPIWFEELIADANLVLPANIETTHRLLFVLCTELRRLRDDVAERFPLPPDDEPGGSI